MSAINDVKNFHSQVCSKRGCLFPAVGLIQKKLLCKRHYHEMKPGKKYSMICKICHRKFYRFSVEKKITICNECRPN